MIAWKTSKLIAIYLVGFVILPGLILSASVDIPTGSAASLCDPSAFPICSCDAEIVVCQFSDNYNVTQMTFSGDNIPTTATRVIIWGSTLEEKFSSLVIEKELKTPIHLEHLVLLGLSELQVRASLTKVDCLNLLLNRMQLIHGNLIDSNIDVTYVHDPDNYPGLGLNGRATLEVIRFFREVCYLRKAVKELKASNCLANSTFNFDNFLPSN